VPSGDRGEAALYFKRTDEERLGQADGARPSRCGLRQDLVRKGFERAKLFDWRKTARKDPRRLRNRRRGQASACLGAAESNIIPLMRVSVIFANYNYAKYLGEALESVFAQISRGTLQVIVVGRRLHGDNGRRGGRYSNRLKSSIRANQGQGAAFNTASRKPRATYLPAGLGHAWNRRALKNQRERRHRHGPAL